MLGLPSLQGLDGWERLGGWEALNQVKFRQRLLEKRTPHDVSLSYQCAVEE